MKNIAIIFVCLLALCSCADKDASLLNLLPVESTVNPNTDILLGYPEARVVDVQINDDGIKGFTDQYSFRTNDYFNSFEYKSHSFPVAYHQLTVKGDNLYHVAKDYFKLNITYSQDYGETWQSYLLDTEDSIPFYLSTSVHVADILFSNNNMIVAIETREETWEFNYYQYKTWIYQVNLTTGVKHLVSTIDGYGTTSLHRYNNRLWIILEKYTQRQGTYYDLLNGYIVRSDNGGVSWTEPVLIDNDNSMKLAVGSDNNLFAFSPQRSAFYSTDAGTTWNVSNQADPRFLSAQFTDATTIFSGTDNVVHKSIDGGANWTPYNEMVQNNYVYGQVRFLNSSTGIVFNDGTTFLTEDGGAHWRLILSKGFVY
jgi:hypothetical protein